MRFRLAPSGSFLLVLSRVKSSELKLARALTPFSICSDVIAINLSPTEDEKAERERRAECEIKLQLTTVSYKRDFFLPTQGEGE